MTIVSEKTMTAGIKLQKYLQNGGGGGGNTHQKFIKEFQNIKSSD
jgi:hypothetical protein